MDQLLSSQQMEDASAKFTACSAGRYARMRSDLMQRAALRFLCGRYRYRLGRCRASSLPLAFIRLNPRTIDAEVVDGATIRCEHYVLLEDNTIACDHAQRPDMPAPVGRWTSGCDQHELIKAQAGDAK